MMRKGKWIPFHRILAIFVEFVRTKVGRAVETANGQALPNIGK